MVNYKYSVNDSDAKHSFIPLMQLKQVLTAKWILHNTQDPVNKNLSGQHTQHSAPFLLCFLRHKGSVLFQAPLRTKQNVCSHLKHTHACARTHTPAR